MLRAFNVALLIFFSATIAQAQLTFAGAFAPQPFLPNSAIIPVPGTSINYTQVMFDHPAVKGAVSYSLTITETSGDNPGVTYTVRDTGCSSLVKTLSFGRSYKWIYTALNKKGKALFTSPEYIFTILSLPEEKRVRVVTENTRKGLVSFDVQGLIVDWSGTPVWFLPEQFCTQTTRGGTVSDIKVSSAGTITFISQQSAFEIMPDGRVSWQSPKVGVHTIETIHDCIQRMPNGHIMTLGTHTMPKQVPFQNSSVPVEFGVIAEYDRAGNIVWKWDAYSYVMPAEIEFRKLSSGEWNSSSGLTAFEYVIESGVEYVYASFRDLNRIIKIEKKSSKVVAVYGRRMNGGYGWNDDRLFAGQSDVTPLSNGDIAVFNNDSVSLNGVVSSVVVFSPIKNGDYSKSGWRFACDFDKSTNGKITKGGSIDELPDHNLLVNLGEEGRCIEITGSGKVTWDAFAETKLNGADSWTVAPQNRTNYVVSLYPVWFSVSMMSSNKKAITISIRNEGEAADSYAVEYFVKDKWLSLASVTLQPEKQTSCVIPKVETVVFSKIRVVSSANPDFVRTLDVHN